MPSSALGAPAPTSFEPAPSSGATGQHRTAECLGCVISGRPLPAEHVRPPATLGARPATVEAGIARILSGPGSG